MIRQDIPPNVDRTRVSNKIDINGGGDTKRSQESKDNYYKEWGDIIENLKFFQFLLFGFLLIQPGDNLILKTLQNLQKFKDNKRLINSAFGCNHRICRDLLDLNFYQNLRYFLNYSGLINVFGEFGGFWLKIIKSTWIDSNLGYVILNDKNNLTKMFID